MADPSRTFGADSCWLATSIPDALRMWLDSLAPLAGSRSRRMARPTGMPSVPSSSAHRQLPKAAATTPTIQMPKVWDTGSAPLW